MPAWGRGFQKCLLGGRFVGKVCWGWGGCVGLWVLRGSLEVSWEAVRFF